MEKFKSLPIWAQIIALTFLIGVVGAAIMASFGIDLNTLWRTVYFVVCMAIAYIIIKKPFKKK